MMKLPSLSPEERVHLQSSQPDSVFQTLAERMRRHLLVSLGVAVSVSALPGNPVFAQPNGDEPVIRIDPALAFVWLSVRFGGKAGTAGLMAEEGVMIDSLRALIRRALAEAIINLGDAAWPSSLHLLVAIGTQQGGVEIFWNGERAVMWARRAIREKP